jgi:nucleoside-diphosphate-sugar epimerase
MRKVMVVGAGGYVGSSLVPKLLELNYQVIAFDTYWYGRNIFQELERDPRLEIVEGDIRDEEAYKPYLKEVTDVIHLACISNDPSFDLNPALGKSINLDSFAPFVSYSKTAGIKRFIYASSSSVYGVKEELNVTEKLSLEPLTDYSRYKAICEEILLDKTSNDFCTTVLRPATVCGYSKRQRLDLAVNILTNHAINRNEITVFGGEQFRPNLHVSDMVEAYIHILNQETKEISGETFNVGGENLSLNSIADIVSRVTEVKNIRYQDTDDRRSYRVDSSYIGNKIGFYAKKRVEDAVVDLVRAFANGLLDNPLDNEMYFNIKRMKKLKLA